MRSELVEPGRQLAAWRQHSCHREKLLASVGPAVAKLRSAVVGSASVSA